MTHLLHHAKLILLSGLLLASIVGCHQAKVAQPLTQKLAGNDPDTQLEFWHTLASRNITSNDEAFHGLLLYTDGQDNSADYAARVETLKTRKMLPKNFKGAAETAVERGYLAVAICRILEIKGGLMMHLTNSLPRYAVRELQFMDLYPVSSPNQTFSGTEFLGIIGRMEDYQRGNAANVPASVMPTEIPTAAPPPRK